MNNSRFQNLISELANPDTKAADAAGRALIDLGNQAIPILITAAYKPPTSVKRRVVFLLGQLGRRPSPFSVPIQNALSDALKDEDWKVRRNSAIALGKAGDDLSLKSVLNSLKEEKDPRVRASLILSFGKLATLRDIPLLAHIEFTSDPERVAAHKVADRFSAMTGAAPIVDTDAPLSHNVSVELWSRAGVADIVAFEAVSNNLDATMLTPDRVRVRNPPNLNAVLNIRSALFPILLLDLPNGHATPLTVGKAFDESIVVDEMLRLTKGTPVPYRLTVKPGGLHVTLKRRDWISQFEAGCKRVVNRATGYTWEVFVRTVNNRLLLGARPACDDGRFAYRKLDVPASIHPTLAAAAVRLAPTQASDLIVDPFCGSGTLLAERAFLAPYSRLIGIDRDQKALLAARTNLAGVERLDLEQSDFATLTKYAPVDTIITNPPYGLRVSTESSARSLHGKLDQLAAETLRSGGTLISFRPPAFPNPRGLKVIQRKRVDAGGLPIDILVARKQ